MNIINVSTSDALFLAHEIELELQSNLDNWIQAFECEILTARNAYDTENNNNARLYPEQSVLERRYAYWAKKLVTFSNNEQRLITIANLLKTKFAELKTWVIHDEALSAKLKRIHRDVGPIVAAYHSELQSRVARLTHSLNKIDELIKTADTEIYWIQNHPHIRMQQMIARVRNGEERESWLSSVGDRISRNFPPLWGTQRSSIEASTLSPASSSQPSQNFPVWSAQTTPSTDPPPYPTPPPGWMEQHPQYNARSPQTQDSNDQHTPYSNPSEDGLPPTLPRKPSPPQWTPKLFLDKHS